MLCDLLSRKYLPLMVSSTNLDALDSVPEAEKGRRYKKMVVVTPPAREEQKTSELFCLL